MRVLLDENLPRAFASELKGHRVRTVQSRKREGSADWVRGVEEWYFDDADPL